MIHATAPSDGPQNGQLSTEELATAAFEASERVRWLGMMNTPTDYEARKKQAVDYALAQEAAMLAQQALDEKLRGG